MGRTKEKRIGVVYFRFEKNAFGNFENYDGRLMYHLPTFEELDGPAVSALRRAILEVKQRWSVIR
jgi:hypothetical protein